MAVERSDNRANAVRTYQNRAINLLLQLGLFVFASVPGRTALDPTQPVTQYVQDVWGGDSGLPQNWVLAVAQTRDGYLWLGTEEGLARFDGKRFTVFDKRNTSALQSNHISALLVDSRGSLWIGTQGGGLIRLQNGVFRSYTTRAGLSNDSVLSLYEDMSGVLWIGTDGGGLDRFENGKFDRFSSRDGLPNDAIFSLAGSKDGTLWIGTHAGLAKLKNGRITTYTTKDGLADNYVRCLYIERGGAVWIGTNQGGLSHFVNGRFLNYTTRDGLSSNTIWSLYEDSTETLWVGTFDGGLCRFWNNKFSTYGTKDGLPAKGILTILEDREGDLWIGTGGGGLARLKNASFTVIGRREGLSDDVVLPVFEAYDGAIWAGTNGGGLNRLHDGHITTYTTRDGLSDNVVFSIAEDKNDTLWVATRKGLNRLRDGRFQLYNTRDGLPTNIVMCLYRDREGILWAGSRAGLSRFDGRRFISYTTKDGLSSDSIVSLYEDRQNTLWIGTAAGLNRLQNGRFTAFTTKDGLSSNAIWSLSGDADGALWIATSGGGLDRLKGGKFAVITTRQGLFDDEIFKILLDQNANFWMSSNKGIFRVPKRQLDALADGRLRVIVSTTYGTSEGLRTKECNGGYQPAGWQTKDGRLIFPTMKGLAVVDPQKLKTNRLPPPLVIERVTIDGTGFDLGKAIEAKPGQGELEFEFTAPSLVYSDSIQFKYRLAGFDRDWIDAGQRRTAYYTNIPPGEYCFSVIASNSDGVWNSTGASIDLKISPHFYQTGWFLSLASAVILGLCLGAYRLRIRHLKANEQRLVHLVDERTQALQQEMREKERAHAELAEAQQNLIELSRRSGMAEVATGVLHNVGNVLNSVNIGASIISAKLRDSRMDHLAAAVGMLQGHAHDLSQFIENDPKGQRVLPYLAKLTSHLQSERREILGEADTLTTHIDHIKEIVATQQDYARFSNLVEMVSLPKVVDQAIKMVEPSLGRHNVTVVRELEDVPEVPAARHKVLEVLINLVRNAKQAIVEHDGPAREIRICVRRHGAGCVRIEVHDTGVGLPAENLTRIFAHGFTTKLDGHGFGLHSGALAAQQMHGSLWAESEGVGHGATFVLELPVSVVAEFPEVAVA